MQHSRLKSVVLAFLGIIFIFLTGCNRSPKQQCPAIFIDQVQVSIYLLLSRPECFHNRPVEFSGVIGKGYGNIVIFPTRTDFLTDNLSSTIYLHPKLSPADYERLKAIPHGQYVEIGGVFGMPGGLTVSIFPRVLDKNVTGP